jgi:TetR/AcrR family transcriptional repressor of nem operon
MKIEKKPSKGEQTRQKLLQAALRSFCENGYEASSVDQIVGSIGLTSGVFYANFKSKEDLLKKAIRSRIIASKELLLLKKPTETDREWIFRAVSTYLSPTHRDAITSSCPMSTLSQELTKLGLVHKTGLDSYVQDFEISLRERLESVNTGLGLKAPALMSLCIGGLITARTIKDKNQSDQFLNDCRDSALEFVFSKSNLRGMNEEKK